MLLAPASPAAFCPGESALGVPCRIPAAQLLRATVTSGDSDLNQFDLIPKKRGLTILLWGYFAKYLSSLSLRIEDLRTKPSFKCNTYHGPKELLSIKIPTRSSLSSLSVQQGDGFGGQLLHTFPVPGPALLFSCSFTTTKGTILFACLVNCPWPPPHP